jgi:hypothetical protein
MSPVQNVWRQLVQRRLWPVAIALVAGLAAVPLMLAKDPEPAPAPPAPAADKNDGELATQPIVSLASADQPTKRRKVLGSAKNPFRVDPPKTDAPSTSGGGSSADPAPAGGQPDTAPSGPGADSVPSGGAPVDPAPVDPVTPVEPAAPAKRYAPEELTVRFGSADAVERRSVTKLDPLPSAELPVLIYMGVLADGKTAEFLLDAGVKAIGDGECAPSPDACETIRLRVGETEFFDVVDESGAVTEQYQLDLLKIHNVKKGATPSRTKSAGLKSGPRRTEARSVSRRIAAYLP